MNRKPLTAAIAAIALALPLNAIAAFDAFLKLDGVEGESTDAGHKGEINIDSWSFGATHGTSAGGSASGQAAGRSCFSDLNVTKRFDKASPVLFLKLATGAHIPKGVITVRKAGGTQQEYLVLTMSDVIISSIQHGSGGDSPTESVSFNYSALNIEYHPQGSDGQLLPAVQTTVSATKC